MCPYSHWSPVSCACYGNSKNKPNSSWEGPIFPFYGKHSFILVQKKDKTESNMSQRLPKCVIIKSSYTFWSYMYADNNCLWNYYYNLWYGQIDGAVSFPSVGMTALPVFLPGQMGAAMRRWTPKRSKKLKWAKLKQTSWSRTGPRNRCF